MRSRLELVYTTHALAAAVHFVNFGVGMYFQFGLGGVGTQQITVTQTYPGTDDAATNATCTSSWEQDTKIQETCLFPYDALFFLVFAEIWTAFFHVVYAIETYRIVENLPLGGLLQNWDNDGFHVARWIEYAGSATLYSLGNLVGTGNREFGTFVFAALTLPATQFIGAVIEWTGSGTGLVPRWVSGLLWFSACLPQLAAYVALFGALFNMPEISLREDGRSFDGFRITSWTYFSSYLLFPVIAGLYSIGVPSRKEWKKIPMKRAEFLYSVAGFTTKTVLFYSVYCTVREVREFYGVSETAGVNWAALKWSVFGLGGAAWVILPLLWVAKGLYDEDGEATTIENRELREPFVGVGRMLPGKALHLS